MTGVKAPTTLLKSRTGQTDTEERVSQTGYTVTDERVSRTGKTDTDERVSRTGQTDTDERLFRIEQRLSRTDAAVVQCVNHEMQKLVSGF